ncbi:ras guanine nucleotide exchange factor domain-containing protein [Fomitopsis serialis]|uniref:ras guanine nucleotide exchange factor domain-containing protein n=1 Tax=Fomitopsis serialis TaxID=139415 RepID=UPI002007B9EC|nr:ras guanine nucleotide exchange factor domain-containing protein [Neoantrodia serialis]KAH9936253.1 ras guanine nucleotide exchange factor domain-containing protein [Neoantrodia serialis]
MATMTAAAYGAQYGTSPSTSYGAPQDEKQHPGEDQQDELTTFWCRALYDYQKSDASSLSFQKNDIIEVLSKLESGWWDGLLGEERGWFPSNYVTVISEEEAEMALNGTDMSASQAPSLADDSMVDMAHSMSRSLSQDDEWLNAEMDFPNHVQNPPPQRNGSNGRPTQHNDFWVPQVSQDGRIFYVNTQTGQQSRDLPQEVEYDPDAEVAALGPPTSSRAGSSAGLGLASANGPDHEYGVAAGFGVPRRSRTPEPWMRRLADDGLSYYYVNKLTGEVSWSPPEANPVRELPRTQGPSGEGSFGSREAAPSMGRLRSGSSASATRDRSDSLSDRLSITSEDSDVFPTRRDRSGSALRDAGANGVRQPQAKQISLAPPEHLAKRLHQALAPPPPESPMDLSNQVQEAIAAIVEHLQAVTPRHLEQFEEVDQRVLEVVSTVRNLLYVTATPSGHIPSNLYPRDGQDIRPSSTAQSLQAHLKAAQRKVAGTLSKLVLSALAMQYDPGLRNGDKPNRLESDIAELERAVMAFVADMHHFQEQNAQGQPLPTKRLYGVFSTANVGLGLPGAGVGGTWKGLGYVAMDATGQPPMQILSANQVSDMKVAVRKLTDAMGAVMVLLKRPDLPTEHIRAESQNAIGQLHFTLELVNNIDIARHVDVDGVSVSSGQYSPRGPYAQMVENARLLMRTLEASVQSLYDDGSTLLIAVQALGQTYSREDDYAIRDYIDALLVAILANANVSVQSLESLLVVGYDQANSSQHDYRSSIDWRLSRPPDVLDPEAPVDFEAALIRPPPRALPSEPTMSSMSSFDMGGRMRSESSADVPTSTWSSQQSVSVTDETLVAPSPEPEEIEEYEVEALQLPKSPPRGKPGASKIKKFFGDDAPSHIIEKINADSKPWYLRPNYDPSEIMMEPDGSVRAGSPAALVERLTAHEQGDTTFNQNFLLTFKSFMTVDDLFQLLVRRFYIQAPPNLSPAEFEEWSKLKQSIIRLRVLNIFKTMVTDDGILEKSDLYILGRMKEFASNEDVVNVAAAKQLLILIERSQKGGDAPIKITAVPIAPPAPLYPRNSRKIKLLDIDPIEIARQLTLMEFAMYKKIRPMECLLRSKESKPGKHNDNFSQIIQLSNRIANWVAESVLEREDSKKRALIVKHYITVADRCRTLQNYSTMTAIVSGLATPPIRRLKRTWEQVNARAMGQLRDCESTIDTAKNFTNYRQTLARITPPCVPFIGVYLTTLTFINDGAGDKLGDNMINFRKRQKAAEVIQDIKRWQSKPYNFQTVASILAYLEECFNKYADGFDYADQFWNQSLEREPREREDEKMARLLQESGFL